MKKEKKDESENNHLIKSIWQFFLRFVKYYFIIMMLLMVGQAISYSIFSKPKPWLIVIAIAFICALFLEDIWRKINSYDPSQDRSNRI